jgi:DMSO/TMAO reductase YedYZ heme-binding membrane subunit
MRVTEAYYRLLAATLASLVLCDLHNDMWGYQTGRIYPHRHVPIVPLYGPAGLVLEWACLLTSAVGLWLGVRRPAALGLGAATMLTSLTQHYSNHGTLTFMVLLFTALRPPVADADLVRPNMLLVRWQLAIVYVFTAVNKVIADYLAGDSMANLYLVLRDPLVPREWFEPMFRPPAVALSVGIVLVELLIPLALSRRPWVGIALVLGLHGGITLLMPGVLSFGMLMVTMSVVYLVPLRARVPVATALPEAAVPARSVRNVME